VCDAVTSHIIISHSSSGSYKQNIISSPTEVPSQALDSTSVDTSPCVLHCMDDNVFDPSNPNHHQMGRRPKMMGNRHYEAVVRIYHSRVWSFSYSNYRMNYYLNGLMFAMNSLMPFFDMMAKATPSLSMAVHHASYLASVGCIDALSASTTKCCARTVVSDGMNISHCIT
jgi:hypothetical protein